MKTKHLVEEKHNGLQDRFCIKILEEMEDDLKILKVEYLSNHILDHT